MPQYEVEVEHATLKKSAGGELEHLLTLAVRVSPRVAWRIERRGAELAEWARRAPPPLSTPTAAADSALFAALASAPTAAAACAPLSAAIRRRLEIGAVRAHSATRELLGADEQLTAAFDAEVDHWRARAERAEAAASRAERSNISSASTNDSTPSNNGVEGSAVVEAEASDAALLRRRWAEADAAREAAESRVRGLERRIVDAEAEAAAAAGRAAAARAAGVGWARRNALQCVGRAVHRLLRRGVARAAPLRNVSPVGFPAHASPA